MYTYRKANNKDFSKVIELWNESFGTDKYCLWFLKNIFSINDVIVCEADENIASMLIRMKYNIYGIGKTSYIYGACTDKEYKNRGIMTELLKYSEKIDKQEDYFASMLIPANKSLFEFYNKRGFETRIFCNSYKYLACNNDNGLYPEYRTILLDFNHAEEILNIYNCMNQGKRYVIRNIEYIKKQINYYYSTDGFLYGTLENKKISSYAFCSRDEKNIYIDEMYYLSDKHKELLLKSLYNTSKCDIFVRDFQNTAKTMYGCTKIYNDKINNDIVIAGLLFD